MSRNKQNTVITNLQNLHNNVRVFGYNSPQIDVYHPRLDKHHQDEKVAFEMIEEALSQIGFEKVGEKKFDDGVKRSILSIFIKT